ncbi:hypothetical protein [Paenarthrobacter aurescens]|jgi:hypothetical protein|uniref:Uncharacterized protein n=1 Tax=Paenarthrobacter aurescens (strain TC1) TaxID=290340 RepID=A1R7I2_PAEAT|nr:hypothetical protein [Paenarthrobacter aurescens]ABM09625.1 hypothetical protein AAur_2468 [Paenarthrobacter aurescens TC1]
MMARRLVIAGICLAVLIAAVAVVLDQMAGKPGPSAAQSTTSSAPTPGSNATASGTPTPGGAGEPAQSGSPTSGAEGSAGNNSEEEGGPSTAKPLEVLPPVTATPTGLPEPSAPAPLITTLPEPGSAAGEVVDGWPADILTLPQGTTIGSTSISTSGDVLQVTADGIIAKPQAEVLASFRQSLVAHGFWSEGAPAAEGAVAERFVRGTDTVTVSVSTTGTGNSRFQLLGSLHTAAD